MLEGYEVPLSYRGDRLIVPSHDSALGANGLEYKKRYDIITDEAWYILVKV